jgi:hypothetical protein
MRRFLVLLTSIGMLALATAAVASAMASFNPVTGDGFIARGDVISSLGKDALEIPVPWGRGPVVSWSGNREATITCSFSDGSTRSETVNSFSFWLVFPEARINANGVITGYVTPGTVIDSGSPGGLPAPDCPPSPDGIELPTIEVSYGSWFDTHLFFIAASGESAEIPYLLVN